MKLGIVFCRRLCGAGWGIMKKSTIIMLVVAIVAVAGSQFGWW
ncbi:MAG: protein YoaJ [Klebsiella sp.]|nr:protein YoaJ [Klebsiella sp.]